MNSYSHIRSVIGTPVYVAALLAAPVCFGAAADRQQVQAQVLDHAEFLCANCLLGASDYYYCFAADNKILIGYQRTRVLNWQDETKNYLTGVHGGWAAWTAPGQTVPISYDDKHIWVSRAESKQVRRDLWAHVKAIGRWIIRADSKQVRLTQSPLRDIFLNNDRCRDADKAKAN
jgi:hypothetical protein